MKLSDLFTGWVPLCRFDCHHWIDPDGQGRCLDDFCGWCGTPRYITVPMRKPYLKAALMKQKKRLRTAEY